MVTSFVMHFSFWSRLKLFLGFGLFVRLESSYSEDEEGRIHATEKTTICVDGEQHYEGTLTKLLTASGTSQVTTKEDVF